MVDQEQDIQACIQALRGGGWVSFGEGMIADATEPTAGFPPGIITGHRPVILLADERDLYAIVAAPDPSVLDFLAGQSPHTAIIYEGILGIDPAWLDETGAAAILVAPDLFLRHLIKRLQRPLVWLPVPHSINAEVARYSVTTPDHHGQTESIRIFRWENGLPFPV